MANNVGNVASNSFGGLLSSLTAKPTIPNLTMPAPNMSTPQGPAYGGAPKMLNISIPEAPKTQEVKKVVQSSDGGQETHYYPSTTGQSKPSNSIANPGGGSTLTAPGANLSAESFATPNVQTSQNQAPIGQNYTTPSSTVPTSSGLIGSLANFQTPASAQGQQQSNQAFGQTQGYIDQLTQSRLNEAEALKNVGTQPIPMGDITGRQQAIANYYAQQQAGLGAGAQAASNLYAPGLNAAVSGQGTRESALFSAANLVPSPLLYGAFGGTGSGIAGGGITGNYSQDISSAAQAIMQNPTLYNSYANSLGFYGSTAKSALDAAILKAGGNPTAFAAQSGAQATNIGTAGTAPTSTYSGIYSDATQKAAQFSQQQSAINSIGNQALEIMNNTPGINPTDSRFLNTKLNDVASQFSSPQYAAFNTAIQSLKARIGQALQAGEIPTAATSNASSIADGSITVGALASTLQQVDKEMGTFVQTQQDLANYAQGKMQNTTTPSQASSQGGGFTEGQTTSSGGYNFVYKNGQWVAQ